MKWQKRLSIVVAAGILGMLSVAFAEDPNPSYSWNGTSYPTVNVVTDGKTMNFDTPAILIHDRTMVPLRFVSDMLGSSVTWDPNSKSVSVLLSSPLALPAVPLPALLPVTDHGTFQGMPVVDVYVNGHKMTGDTPAILFNDRTMVPVRFVSEALGCKVSWDPSSYTVTIAKPGLASPGASGPGLSGLIPGVGGLSGQ
jgi:hypothetical protein